MGQESAQEIVRKAIERDEVDLLLLGKPGYKFLPKWSPAPGDTDLTALLSALRGLVGKYPHGEIRDLLYRAIRKIVGTYEGLDPVACCLICEAVNRSEGKSSFELPVDEIAAELRQSIMAFRSRLERDKTGFGAEWPDGMLGDLRRLSRNTEHKGGPSFCD
ncbi:MAG: hypothetical protein ABFC96_02985 [Thermoguttaceae bacterium]